METAKTTRVRAVGMKNMRRQREHEMNDGGERMEEEARKWKRSEEDERTKTKMAVEARANGIMTKKVMRMIVKRRLADENWTWRRRRRG